MLVFAVVVVLEARLSLLLLRSVVVRGFRPALATLRPLASASVRRACVRLVESF